MSSVFRRGGKEGGELRWASNYALDVCFRGHNGLWGYSGLGSGTQDRVSQGSKEPECFGWAWRCALGRGLGGASARRLIELQVCRPTRGQSAAAETMGREAMALVGLLLGLGLLLCELGSLASAEPRAPPDRIGRCGGYGARHCRGPSSLGGVVIGVPRSGPRAIEARHWRRGQAPHPVSLQPQPGMGSPQH